MMADQYLIETEYEDEMTVRFLDELDAADYLTRNIQQQHYSGDGDAIKGIWLYVSPGSLCELKIVAVDEERTPDDFLDWSYAVHEKADSEAFGEVEDNKIFEFTVRIDGRA